MEILRKSTLVHKKYSPNLLEFLKENEICEDVWIGYDIFSLLGPAKRDLTLMHNLCTEFGKAIDTSY